MSAVSNGHPLLIILIDIHTFINFVISDNFVIITSLITFYVALYKQTKVGRYSRSK